MQMAAIFTHKWASQFPTAAAYELTREQWRKGLASLNEVSVRIGLRKCRQIVNRQGESWPPNIAEFAAMCRPSAKDLGLPGPREAYLAACRGDWTHGIVWHTTQAIGGSFRLSKPESQVWPEFETKYKELLTMAANGKPFDIPKGSVPEIGHDKPSKTTAPGDARAHLAVMRQMLTGRPAHNRPDKEGQ